MATTIVSAGMISSFVTLNAFDALEVLSGGSATNITVNDDGDLYVLSGGGAEAVDLNSGGGAFIGGSALDFTVNQGGMLVLVEDGVASVTTVAAGGEELAGNHGATSGAQVLNGGRQVVVSGGFAYAATVSGGQLVSSGGLADAGLIAGGGFEAVFSGGVSDSATVDSGGTILVLPGGGIENIILQAGADVISTGVAVISPGGIGTVASPALGLVIGAADSAFVLSSGVTDAMVIGSGGAGFVEAGGVASATGVVSGGALNISGGVAYGTTVSGLNATSHSYQTIAAGGVASATIVENGGAENVSGGMAFGTNLFSGGAQFVRNGSAVSAVVDDGGYQFIGAGGVASGSMVLGGGSENVSGGTAYATVVSAFGRDTAGFGGSLSGGVVDSAGAEYLAPGGRAVGTDLLSGARQFLRGGTAVATQVQGGSSEIVSGNAAYPSAVSETDGTVILDGGTEIVDAKGEAINTTIAGGTLELNAGALASGGIDFSDGGLLSIDTAPAAEISGLADGGGVLFAELVYDVADQVSVTAPGVVTVTSGGVSYNLHVAGAEIGETDFQLTSLNGEVLLSETLACFAAGTGILTPGGAVRVEHLVIGDKVITGAGEDAAIVWIGRRWIDLRRHARPELVQPVRITADAFADGVPRNDLFLSPDHALFFEGCLVPVKALVNGMSVRQMRFDEVMYYHVEMADHAVIFAENCAVESYLETGNRGAFENALEKGYGAVVLHPEFAQARREAESCAAFVEAGEVVEAIRRRLWQRESESRHRWIASSRFREHWHDA